MMSPWTAFSKIPSFDFLFPFFAVRCNLPVVFGGVLIDSLLDHRSSMHCVSYASFLSKPSQSAKKINHLKKHQQHPTNKQDCTITVLGFAIEIPLRIVNPGVFVAL